MNLTEKMLVWHEKAPLTPKVIILSDADYEAYLAATVSPGDRKGFVVLMLRDALVLPWSTWEDLKKSAVVPHRSVVPAI